MKLVCMVYDGMSQRLLLAAEQNGKISESGVCYELEPTLILVILEDCQIPSMICFEKRIWVIL